MLKDKKYTASGGIKSTPRWKDTHRVHVIPRFQDEPDDRVEVVAVQQLFGREEDMEEREAFQNESKGGDAGWGSGLVDVYHSLL